MKIALIHATPLSIAPIESAFLKHWPQADLVNILDDSLSRDRLKSAELNESIFKRIETLALYADSLNVDAILFTCSAFAQAIEAVAKRLHYPVWTPNQSMLKAAIEHNHHIGVVASFAATANSISQEINVLAQKFHKRPEVKVACEEAAMRALADGDSNRHDALLLKAAQTLVSRNPELEVILLAQYSSARAASLIQDSLNLPVLTSPDSAVIELSALLNHQIT